MTAVVMCVPPVAGTALGVTLPATSCAICGDHARPRHYMVDGPLTSRWDGSGRRRRRPESTAPPASLADPMGLRTVARATGVHIVMDAAGIESPSTTAPSTKARGGFYRRGHRARNPDGATLGIQPGIIQRDRHRPALHLPAEGVFRGWRGQKRTGLSVTTIPPAARSGSPSSTFGGRCRLATGHHRPLRHVPGSSFTRRSPDGSVRQFDNMRGDAETRGTGPVGRRLVDAGIG
jgi:hypothetical protein